MKFKFIVFMALICLNTVKGFTSEISNFDILDLKLGMTIEETREKYPAMEFKIVKHWGTGDILYYRGIIDPSKFNNWQINSLFFSSFKDGKKLFKLGVEQFVGENVLNELKEKILDKYGVPDCQAQNGNAIEFKWGRCNKRDRFLEHTSRGKFFRFFYDSTQVHLMMENIEVSKEIDRFVKELDEKTRLKEVLELDF